MKLREVIIRNFRNLENIDVPIDDMTVLIGENNSGKTAFLDALRIALTSQSSRRNPFDEYDYHMAQKSDIPETSEGITIELWFREDTSDKWEDTLIQALSDIVQLDPHSGLHSIGLRITSKYDTQTREINAKYEFLTVKRGALRSFSNFSNYLRLFYLPAIRDSEKEFNPRSQFWGRILRDLKISDKLKEQISNDLNKLNDELLRADPRLGQVSESLDNIQKAIPQGANQKTSIQPLPLKHWELMSRSQVVMGTRGSEIDLPLSQHGQGMQSLAVIFLFQAYIDVLLKPTFNLETEAIITLEEPEAHLHPQAARALAGVLKEIKAQKIISSHSPYFIQEIPFSQIRLFRRKGPSATALFIKRSFFAEIAENPQLVEYCKNNSEKYHYHKGSGNLEVRGRIEKDEFRKLLKIFSDKKEAHATLRRLYTESQCYLNDEDLIRLETFAKRMRGEVFFASAWLLCEGQSEYILLRYFSELLGKPFDRMGITVIDFQNNGSPGSFVGLAKTFEIPWVMICDNDQMGEDAIRQIKNYGVSAEEERKLVKKLPGDNMVIEKFLLGNGFLSEYMLIFLERRISIARKPGEAGFEDEVFSTLEKDKVGYMNALIEVLRKSGADSLRIPEFFKDIIETIIRLAE